MAICSQQRVEYAATWFPDHGHSRLLAPLIQTALSATGLSVHQLDALAVGAGPGSYTGLRISTSVAKGICFGAAKPLIAVGTMENLAHQVFALHTGADCVVTLLDARRDEVYIAILDREMRFVLPVQARVLSDLPLPDLLGNRSAVLAGSGAAKTAAFFPSHENWKVDESLQPDAATTGRIALEKWANGQVENLAAFEPQYIKPVFFTQPKQ